MGRLFLLTLAALAGVAGYGFLTASPIHLDTWYPEGPWRLVQFAGIYAACAITVLILVPWTFGRLSVATLVILTVIVAGPLPLLAVAFLLASALCLGNLAGITSHLAALLTGLSLYMFAMTFAVRLPVNYPAVYLAALAIPIALRWRDLARLHISAIALDTWGERAAFAALMFSLATHCFAVLKPETGADGLAVHLAIPIDIATHHVMTFEPARWVWAVMPMSADYLWSIVYMLGGEPATHLFNYAVLLALLGLLYGLLRHWISRAAAFLLLALFASSPMVQWVTGTLLSENLLAALLLGALAAMWRYGETGERRFLHAAALMAGAAMSTKLGAITLVAVALPFAVIEVRRRPKTRRAWLAAVILLALAVPPYAIAWAKTGNPLFPFLNERFHSPLLPPNTRITEQRYHEPLKWNTAYHLTFHTHSYSEGRDGELGFQYLLLAPLALMALFADRSRQVAAAVIAVVSSLLILGTQPIARYLYAGLPLFYIPAAALLAWAGAHHRVLFRVLVAVCAACIVLNTCVLSAQGYYYSFYPPFTQVQRLSWLRHSGPERLMIDEYNRRHAGEAVLQVQDSFHAGLQAEVYENHWHQAATRDALRGAETPGEVHRLLDRWRVRNAIGRVPKAGEHVYPPALERFLDDCALPELIVDDLLLSHLEPGCSGPAIPRESPRPRIPARPGIYDDISPYIVYRGGWQHDDIFPEAFRGTVSYHDLSGAVAVLSLEGSEVMWVYTAAPNRGIATVTIDGVDRGTVDQYASSIHWQQRHQLRMGDSGPHLLVIRVTGRSRPEAAGSFIDVDSFEVKP